MSTQNDLSFLIKQIGYQLGFKSIGITSPLYLEKVNSSLPGYEVLPYLSKNKNLDPLSILKETQSVIVGLYFYPKAVSNERAAFSFIPDYTKLICSRLNELMGKITPLVKQPFNYKIFAGNAPFSEKRLAIKAGLGWQGKNTLLITPEGSYALIGEILTDLKLSIDPNNLSNRCYKCEKCLKICPTGALTPFRLNPSKCISYWTIESKTAIPLPYRPFISSFFGCDLCQNICPYNKIQHHCSSFNQTLVLPNINGEALYWSEDYYRKQTANSSLARLKYRFFLRNLATWLGNQPFSNTNYKALLYQKNNPDILVREHVEWALQSLALAKSPLLLD